MKLGPDLLSFCLVCILSLHCLAAFADGRKLAEGASVARSVQTGLSASHLDGPRRLLSELTVSML